MQDCLAFVSAETELFKQNALSYEVRYREALYFTFHLYFCLYLFMVYQDCFTESMLT